MEYDIWPHHMSIKSVILVGLTEKYLNMDCQGRKCIVTVLLSLP